MTELHMGNLNATLENMLEKYNVVPPSLRKNKANIMLCGKLGTGKTQLAATAPKPVWFHSFDPGGLDTIRDIIDGKEIIGDTQFEGDDPKNPTKFAQWDSIYHRMKADGVFDKIGTFVLDSATTWGDTIMNYVLKAAGRLGTFPYENDWPQQMVRLQNSVLSMLTLPCNVIFIAHPVVDKDSVTGRMSTTPMITGKLREKIPLLFGEIYYTVTAETSRGTEYKLLTQPDGLYNARTRLGGGDRLEKYEEMNLTNVLRKCGLTFE